MAIDMSLSKPWEMMKDREAWHAAVPGIAKSGTQLHNKKMNGAGEVRQSLDNFFKKFVFKEGH